ncbi:D-alanyl-D-alanine carboxypeptidase [bacterium]|jgi:serine-type D-Ala-D-Ala endopeptidase (penicillin-binding protein 7)|nr:D-alanyl-D-alanine carboxypeptidase [bacterium]MBT4649116.1 D-alanyl-D-alanine carboxypeptidase [bacterium]
MWELIAKVLFGLNLLTVPIQHVPSFNLENIDDNLNISVTQQKFEGEQVLPHKINPDSLGVKITSQYSAIMDKDSGAILWQHNADEVRSLASITKLMTALVFLDHNPGWQTIMTMEQKDEINGGVPHIKRDERAKVRDLFYTTLIASDNTAARALVRSTGMDNEQFVKKMNDKATALGLSSTYFVDVTGLSVDNKSTALDVLKLAKEALSQEDIKAVTSKRVYSFTTVSGQAHRIFSTNKLLDSYLDVVAGKTGFITASGYCLVAEITGADGHNVIGVVLGSATHDDRFQDLKILSAWVLDNFSWS